MNFSEFKVPTEGLLANEFFLVGLLELESREFDPKFFFCWKIFVQQKA
jgi:hypothetical protein